MLDMIYCVFCCIVLSFASSTAIAMGKERSAGMLVFRRANSQIEYLLLNASEFDKNWSPPKGCTFSTELHFVPNFFLTKTISFIRL